MIFGKVTDNILFCPVVGADCNIGSNIDRQHIKRVIALLVDRENLF